MQIHGRAVTENASLIRKISYLLVQGITGYRTMF